MTSPRRTLPPDSLAFVLDAGSGEREFRALPELLDRRPNTIGNALTTPLKDRVSLKPLNRLTQVPLGTVVEMQAGELATTLAALRSALPSLVHRWYWFANPGATCPPGAEEVRTIDPEIGTTSLWGGLDRCEVSGSGGRIDLRGQQTAEIAEGTVEIRSEGAEQRFGPELEAALSVLAGASVVRATFRTRKRDGRPRWRTLERTRLENHAPPLRKVVERVLGDSLRTAGFVRTSDSAGFAWVRRSGERLHVLSFDRARFAPRFDVALAISTAAAQPRDPPLRAAELLDLEHPFEERWAIVNEQDLERRLRQAWDLVTTTGEDWWRDPDVLDWDGWKERGLLDGHARRANRLRRGRQALDVLP